MKRRIRSDSRGQALVEFALTFPILILLIFGLIDLGRAVYVSNSLAEAARDGARYGSVQARSYNAASRAEVEAWVEDRLVSIPDATVTVSCTPAVSTFGCTVNDILVVTVESEVEMITPIIGQIVGTLSLEGRSEVVVNN